MRILLEVVTPGNGKTYELMLDDTLTVKTAKESIIEQIVAFENGNIDFDENVALFLPATQNRLLDHKNLRKAGVKSGQPILLL